VRSSCRLCSMGADVRWLLRGYSCNRVT
jgi:hypothetical protein